MTGCWITYRGKSKNKRWRLVIRNKKEYTYTTQKEAEDARVLFKQTGVPPLKIGVCKGCNEKFSMYRSDQLYCSRKCYIKNRKRDRSHDARRDRLLRNHLNKDYYARHKDAIRNAQKLKYKKAQIIAETLNITVRKACTLVTTVNLLTKETENA